MRTLNLSIAITVLLLACAGLTFNQEKPASTPAPVAQSDQSSESLRLTTRINELYQQGKYDEAIPLAKRVLEIEQSRGPETVNVAAALSNLGELYFEKRNDGEAEKLFQKAAGIYEKNQTKSSAASQTLERLAQLAFKKRNNGGAINLLEQSLTIREQTAGRDSVAVSETLHELANVFQVNRQWDKADSLYLRSIEIKEKVLGRNNENTVAAMKDYACAGIKSKPYPPVKEDPRSDLSESEAQQESIRMRAACWLYGFENDCDSKVWKPPQKPMSLLNGKAVRLAQPPYPVSAQQKHLSGRVFVAVRIDEEGNVVNAKSVCGGYPELNEAGVAAARASKFTPTKLDKPVQVNGIIIYNFVAQ